MRRPGPTLWGMLVLVACADATAPFQPVDRLDESEQLPRQLTFAPADDRGPVWDGEREAVLYTTEGSSPFPEAPGLLLAVPSSGGTAAPLLPSLQFAGGPAPWFASPVPAPGDDRVAWVELWGVRHPNVCPGTQVMCTPEGGTDGVATRLSELRLRVRRTGDVGSGSGPMLRVPVLGLTEVPPQGGLTTYQVDNYPFQRLFHTEGMASFRPSWSPDGTQLAFSDGLRILVWQVGAGDPLQVPGTEDGVQAAWSPDGRWLAFTRLVRGAPEAYGCDHLTPLGAVCRQVRFEHPIVRREVVVIRPDGSEATVVGPGDDPAWMPEADRLVIRRQGRLWLVGLDGTAGAPLAGTEGGREPSVSPDGTTLAFARIDPQLMTHDVWLVALEPGP